MEGLVDKISRKMDNNSNQAHLAELAKTSLFAKLMNNFEATNQVYINLTLAKKISRYQSHKKNIG
jgi:hypothetical protein